MAWYFQATPHDTHDYDAVQTEVLVDATYQGKPRRLLLTANKNAYYYVLDRETGERLELPLANVTLARLEIDL